MKTLICYTGRSRMYEQWIERGKPDGPNDLPFRMPKSARRGDRYLIFVGGHISAFVGYGRLTSGWQTGRSGAWKDKGRVFVAESKLVQPVPGTDVEAATGLPIPRRSGVVEPSTAGLVWRVAKGEPLSSVERAVEGASSRGTYQESQRGTAACSDRSGEWRVRGVPGGLPPRRWRAWDPMPGRPPQEAVARHR